MVGWCEWWVGINGVLVGKVGWDEWWVGINGVLV